MLDQVVVDRGKDVVGVWFEATLGAVPTRVRVAHRHVLTVPARNSRSLDGMRVPRTFVFIDLSGFTNYTGAFGDDAAGRLLSAFRTIVRQVASERGVRIAKWLGDGCMIVAVDQPEAIAFTLDLRARSADVCAPLTVRGGIATGMPCCSKATTTSVRRSTWPRGCATPPARARC